MKRVILLRGPQWQEAFNPAQWVSSQPWAAYAERLVVHVGLPVVAETGAEPTPALYDAVVELWSNSPLDAEALCKDWLWVEQFTSTQVVGKAADHSLTVGVTPGLSQLSFIRAIDGMTRAEVERHWDQHIPLACAIHVGMNRYVQDRLVPSVPWFGMAHLHFPNEEALRDGLFRSAEDVAAITADVAEFVSDYATMTAIEHVLRA